MDIDDKILQLIPAPAGWYVKGFCENDGTPYTHILIAFALAVDRWNNQRIFPLGTDYYGNIFDAGGMEITDKPITEDVSD